MWRYHLVVQTEAPPPKGKRLTIAQVRFPRAVEALAAKVPKLSRAVPVQINVAQQQVNVAKGEA